MDNISWVTEQLAVGGAFMDQDIPALKEQGINAVLDIRSERGDNERLLREQDIRYIRVGVSDTRSPSLEQLRMIIDFAEPLLEKGRKILIHCQNGAGRSTLAAVAVLVKRGMKIHEAVKLVKHRHPQTGFSEDQKLFLDNDLADFLKA